MSQQLFYTLVGCNTVNLYKFILNIAEKTKFLLQYCREKLNSIALLDFKYPCFEAMLECSSLFEE